MATFLTCAKCKKDYLVPDDSIVGIHPDDLARFCCLECDINEDPEMLRRRECANCGKDMVVNMEDCDDVLEWCSTCVDFEGAYEGWMFGVDDDELL